MFLEPNFKGQRSGWIEVICGSMFSGKTEELIRRMRRAKIANQKVVIFKPLSDIRYDEKNVVSHDFNTIESVPIRSSKDISRQVSGIEVVGIDMDYLGRPFGPIPNLLAIAEYITKVHAICPHCGNLATHSYRLTDETDTVVLGEKDKYEPRCRTCYHMGNILNFQR